MSRGDVCFMISGISERWQLCIFCPTCSDVNIYSIERHPFKQLNKVVYFCHLDMCDSKPNISLMRMVGIISKNNGEIPKLEQL